MTCKNNVSCNLSLNVFDTSTPNTSSSISIHHHLSTIEIGIILTLATGTTILNLIVLLASKFASGGESPTLVFVRSLCVADVLLGVYGGFKMIMFFNVDILMMNFFLPESLFFTALLASGLSLLSLNIDCSIKLSQPFKYLMHMDKKNIITFMVLLWNFSFIIGFLPQIGWNNIDHVKSFFTFFSWTFFLFHGILVFISIVLNVIMIVFLRTKTKQINTNQNFMRASTHEFQKYHRLVVTTIIDTILWLSCTIPFYTYLGLFCSECPLADSINSDKNIVYFIPVFLVKSFISGLVHGYRTAQIKSVIQNLSRGVSRLMKTSHRVRTNGIPTVYTNNSPINSDQSDDAMTYDGPISRIGSTNSNDNLISDSRATLNTVVSSGIQSHQVEITVL
ncbi:hypothetical protein LOTGIDRAFT_164572 [Lottia gigantea]|uniref:G-protein coupled receptors family 1 profile domain-containing protein n=1 Tax=Lottia gigantea TaxID=225164 RepID=V4BM07_LOTGI|nr:hypothetical protein LOTGIDRAFT_164572 [Lottia gigantea]ESO89879.1 hypothetical protein LOTGIDRAFT_164572 [Lottia gigantea]